MIPTTLREVAEATGGRLAGGADPAAVVDAVVLDSRAAAPGCLFAAVPGERTDGHDHAAAAVAAGAVAVLGEREVAAPCVVVPSTTAAALADLARAALARRRAGEPGLEVLGVTGSSGKTTAKDLLAAVLTTWLGADAVVAPPGSYNNELGVPLTALRAGADTRALVLEMGARGAGHIAALCAVTAPRIGVVLNVGSAHLGEFGGPEAVARAKGELVEALPADGVAVLNADDHAVAAMASRTAARVVTFGLGEGADVRAAGVRLDAGGRASFDLLVPGAAPVPVALRLVGEHHVENALATAAAAHAAGVPAEVVARGLGGAVPASRYRMEVTERPDGVTVVNDAYNANPESARAALRALTALRGPGKARRTWAVLGEMLELGAASTLEHDALGRYAVRLDISRVVAVGPGARPLHLGAVMEGSWGEESAWVPDADAALALLARELAPGDVVLVKGSNATGLHALGEELAAGGPAAGGGAP